MIWHHCLCDEAQGDWECAMQLKQATVIRFIREEMLQLKQHILPAFDV